MLIRLYTQRFLLDYGLVTWVSTVLQATIVLFACILCVFRYILLRKIEKDYFKTKSQGKWTHLDLLAQQRIL